MSTSPNPRPTHRSLLTLGLSLLLLLGLASPAVAQDGGVRSGGEDNEATAVNTEDGGSVFRFALSVRHVADGVIDETNTATAQASCVDCETVAVAFQVILVSGDADVVVPENLAVASNSECAECFTYAAATQLVIGVEPGTRLSPEGQRRLAALQKRMREIEDTADQMTEAELAAAVQEAETELVAIFDEELVAVEPGPPEDAGPADEGEADAGSDGGSSTTTTTTDDATTTTTEAATTTTLEATTTTAVGG